MKILRKYALREMAMPFFISIAFFTFIFMAGNLVKLADLVINKGVDLIDILKILALLVPRLFGFILPTSLLTAILLTFGSFAQYNEIIAMRTCGINLWKIMTPILWCAALLSLVALIFNDQINSIASVNYRRVVKEILIKRPAAYLEAGRLVKEFKDYIILVQKVDGKDLEGVTIYQPQGDKPTRTIIAERGEIISSENDKTLMLKLYNGTSDEPNPDNPNVFYKLDFKEFILPPIRLGREAEKGEKKVKDMTIDELFALIQKNPRKTEEDHLELKQFWSEFHKKISFSFAPLVFALVGLPLAVITRRGEAVVSFTLSLAVVTVYYVLFVVANTLGTQSEVHPFLALWFPNVLMAGLGIFLMRRVITV